MEYFKSFCQNDRLIKDVDMLCETNRLPHAILIVGEKGSGKNLFCSLLAERYLEDKKNMVKRNIHPDCIVLEGKTASGEISVSVIREALAEISKSSVLTDQKRVVVIKNAKNLNRSSFAALLKSIEQPPKGVVFMLTADSRTQVIDTILSRCVVYYLAIPSLIAAREYFEREFPECDKQKLATLLEVFGGRIGLIKKSLEDQQSFERVLLAQNIAKSIKQKDEFSTLSFFDIIKDRAEFSDVIFNVVFCIKQQMSTCFEQAKELLSIIEILQKHERYSGKYANLKLVATSAVSEIFSL